MRVRLAEALLGREERLTGTEVVGPVEKSAAWVCLDLALAGRLDLALTGRRRRMKAEEEE